MTASTVPKVTRYFDALVDALFSRPPDQGLSLALVVQHGGEVVAERYGTQPANMFEPEVVITPDSTLISWSMAKSITHAAVGILANDGLLDLDAAAPVPEWGGTEKEAITLLQLLEMRSGLHFVEDYVDGEASNCIEMLFGESVPSHATYAAAQPLVHSPGSFWNYSSGTTNIVAHIIGEVIGASRDPAVREEQVTEFLRARLFEPTGMTSAAPKYDEAGDFVGSSFVFATARDFARFGELYSFDGVTDRGEGERLLSPGWTDHARTQAATDEETGLGYGRHWWLWPEFPGSLVASGYEGQFVVVLPEDDLVLVHLGKTDADAAPQLRVRLAEIIRMVRGD